MVTPQFQVNETEKRTRRAHSTHRPRENTTRIVSINSQSLFSKKDAIRFVGHRNNTNLEKTDLPLFRNESDSSKELWRNPIINHRLLDLDLQSAHALMTSPKKGAAGLQYLDSFGGLDSSWTWVIVSLQGYSRGTSCIIRGVQIRN